MFLTTLDFFGETHTPVVVDNSGIDVSDFEEEEDKKFLVDKGTELLRIDAKADDAKEKICKAIDDRAEDAKGKVIYEIQERYKNTPELKGGLLRYFHSLGYWATSMSDMGLIKPENSKAGMTSVFRWANGYRGAKDIADQLAGSFTEEEIQAKINSLTPSSLAKIYTSFSAEDRKELYEASGSLTKQAVNDESQKPERQLNKVKEELEEAKTKAKEKTDDWESVKSAPNINSTDKEYHNTQKAKYKADVSVSKLETKIKDLEEQIKAKDKEGEKLKNTIDLLNSPEEEIKQRMVATSNALIATLPNVHSHLQRFYTDIEHYDADTVHALEEHIKLLQSFIEAHL